MAVLKYYDANSQQYHSLPLGNESIAVYNNGYGYSTDEQVVGCWIDGKPLYRKIIALTTKSSTGWTAANHNISNLETVVNAYTMVKYSNGYWSSIGSATTENEIMIDINESEVEIFISHSGGYSKDCNIVVEYTKTTDQPNSFSIDMLSVGDLDTEATDAEVAAVLG